MLDEGQGSAKDKSTNATTAAESESCAASAAARNGLKDAYVLLLERANRLFEVADVGECKAGPDSDGIAWFSVKLPDPSDGREIVVDVRLHFGVLGNSLRVGKRRYDLGANARQSFDHLLPNDDTKRFAGTMLAGAKWSVADEQALRGAAIADVPERS